MGANAPGEPAKGQRDLRAGRPGSEGTGRTIPEARTLRQDRSGYSGASSRRTERLGLGMPREERRPAPLAASHWSSASRSSSGVSSQPLYDGTMVRLRLVQYDGLPYRRRLKW